MVVSIIFDDRNHIRKIFLHANETNAQLKAQAFLKEILVWYKSEGSPLTAKAEDGSTVQIWKPMRLD